MRNNDPFNLGRHDAEIESLQKEGGELDDRLKVVERYISIQKLAIAKCTALWGFIIAFGTAIGGFIVYNFTKVYDAIIAAYEAFHKGN